MSDNAIVQALNFQAGGCEHMGSAFSAVLLRAAAADVAAGGPAAGLFEPWAKVGPAELMRDAAPLRFLGALHERVLGGAAPNLAAHYPAAGAPGDPATAWTAARELIAADAGALAAFMTHEPQTNETRRSICLLGGFLTVAFETCLPLRLLEIGASAGLNQLWDRYRYDLGLAGTWGEAGAPVAMATDWRGEAPPLEAPVAVASRAACDRKPIDLADPQARRRLKAYVWADQTDRLARLDAAVAMALAAGTQVEAEDAVTWTDRHGAPTPGAATVLFHSVFWQYMPAESQAALAQIIERHGAAATPQAPFAWLRMEPSPANMTLMEIRLTGWPMRQERRLATCHPHGAWVDWEG